MPRLCSRAIRPVRGPRRVRIHGRICDRDKKKPACDVRCRRISYQLVLSSDGARERAFTVEMSRLNLTITRARRVRHLLVGVVRGVPNAEAVTPGPANAGVMVRTFTIQRNCVHHHTQGCGMRMTGFSCKRHGLCVRTLSPSVREAVGADVGFGGTDGGSTMAFRRAGYVGRGRSGK